MNKTITKDLNKPIATEGKIVRYVNVERVSVTQFENVSKENKLFVTFSINMSYKNESGEYQRGHSFSLRDLLAVRVAVERAINLFIDDERKEK